MLHLLKTFKNRVKIKSDSPCIDNWVFKLHYRITSIIFFISTILVTSKEYIGESIKCITFRTSDRQYLKFLETYCFFQSTFTVIDDDDLEGNNEHRLQGFGIVPQNMGPRAIRKHMYYQWVPYVLFLQALMFCATRYIWKMVEGGKIQKLVDSVSILEKKYQDGSPTNQEKKQNCVDKSKSNFLTRIRLNQSLTWWYIFFEIVNLTNVLFQIYLTDVFLGKEFSKLGVNFATEGPTVLDRIFPKRTKCTFFQSGVTGTIETIDALCIMALNIINEKIYLFLWFWFVALFVASAAILCWRLVTILLYSRSTVLNNLAFGYVAQTRMRPCRFNTILNHSYSDWFLLRYMAKNMDGLAFKNLFHAINAEIDEDAAVIVSNKDKDNFEFVLEN